MSTHYRLPQNATYQDTFNFLVWEQFPALLEESIEYFAVLPRVGIYKDHVKPDVISFKKGLLETTTEQFTLSGVGSLIDFEKYGHVLKRPTPYLQGTGCNGNSLCLDPTCYSFVEGVQESNNILRDMCWSLSMPCLKDYFYSDRKFNHKMERYFAMFMHQAPAALQAYLRTDLIRNAIKVVATDTNYRFSGPVIGGADGLPLPFFISPTDPLAFPDLSALPGTANIGGFNMMAFMNFVAPRLMGNSFSGAGADGLKVYGLGSDYYTAKEQTASVQDKYMDMEMLRALQMRGMKGNMDMMDSLVGDFVHDPHFPTFKTDATSGTVIPITEEILEPSTIAGYVQTTNPEHSLASVRGLLFVPPSWNYNMVEPPKDDFSDLGLGNGLNFRTNTPGNFPLMSSSLFTKNKLAKDGVFYLGRDYDKYGREVMSPKGVQQRDRKLMEAIRTELMLTYSSRSVNDAVAGQLPNVGSAATVQNRADGFDLKSTMYVASSVKGTARPVLVLFKTDTPRSARPIEVCTVNEVSVTTTAAAKIKSCCPGNAIFASLVFTEDVSADYAVSAAPTDIDAIWRTGIKGASYEVAITGVSESVVTIQASNGTDILPCCAGGADDYGTQGELVSLVGVTATSGEVFKSEYDTGTSSLFVELKTPVIANVATTPGTLTLADGRVVNVTLTVDVTAASVFLQLTDAGGGDCTLDALDCECLVGAIFAYN